MEAQSLTVKAMAEALGLCRDRFYDLIAQGIFPPPQRCEKTGRPYYTAQLLAQCRQIRASGIGRDGRPVRFYRRRRKAARRGFSRRQAGELRALPLHERFASQLRALGVRHASAAAVRQLLRSWYPHGIAQDDEVVVLRRLVQELWEAGEGDAPSATAAHAGSEVAAGLPSPHGVTQGLRRLT